MTSKGHCITSSSLANISPWTQTSLHDFVETPRMHVSPQLGPGLFMWVLGSLCWKSFYNVNLENLLEDLDDISEKLMVDLLVFMLVWCAPFEVATSGLV